MVLILIPKAVRQPLVLFSSVSGFLVLWSPPKLRNRRRNENGLILVLPRRKPSQHARVRKHGEKMSISRTLKPAWRASERKRLLQGELVHNDISTPSRSNHCCISRRKLQDRSDKELFQIDVVGDEQGMLHLWSSIILRFDAIGRESRKKTDTERKRKREETITVHGSPATAFCRTGRFRSHFRVDLSYVREGQNKTHSC